MTYYEIGELLLKMGYKTKDVYKIVVAPLKTKKQIIRMVNYLKEHPQAEFQEIVDKSLEIAEGNMVIIDEKNIRRHSDNPLGSSKDGQRKDDSYFIQPKDKKAGYEILEQIKSDDSSGNERNRLRENDG